MSSAHQHASSAEEPLPPYAIQMTTIPPLFTEFWKKKKKQQDQSEAFTVVMKYFYRK